MNYKEVFEILSHPKNKRIAVLTHINPDGDCLGSAAALYHSLRKIGKTVEVFSELDYSENFDFFTKGIFNVTDLAAHPRYRTCETKWDGETSFTSVADALDEFSEWTLRMISIARTMQQIR